MKKNIISVVKHLFLIALLIVILVPVLFTVTSSFKSNSELLAYPDRIFPHEPTVSNYVQAWNSDVFSIKTMTLNSLYYTLASMIITLVISSAVGYVFARGNFPGKKVMYTIMTALLFVNLGTITMYPYFQVLDLVHIPRSLPALLVIQCFGIPVANIYLVKGFVEGIPYSVDEAAKIDGCSFGGIFLRIILPMVKPILATIAILTFQASWNDYLMPMIFTMTKPEQQTLIVGIMALKSSGEAATSWNLMLAGTTIALIPVLVAYAIGNRYFVEGIAAGAVKG